MQATQCSIDGCQRKASSRQMCSMHYGRFMRHGNTGPVGSYHAQTPQDVDKDVFMSKCLIVESGCWEWQGQRNRLGYGKTSLAGKHKAVHRLSYEMFVGPIPEGLQIDHLCDNPPCCNPAHLRPATAAENVLRSSGLTAANKRKTVCIRGHEFTPENTMHRPTGARRCRKCQYVHRVQMRARKRAARANGGAA